MMLGSSCGLRGSPLKEINAAVKEHVKRHTGEELDGAALMFKAFSPSNPLVPRRPRHLKGSIDDAKLGNLTGLLAKIRPAVSASGPGSAKDDAYVDKVAQANVFQAMEEIREKSPTIKAQLDAGTVGLVGAIYDVSTAKRSGRTKGGLSPPLMS